MRELQPDSIARPFARYAHGVEVPAGARMVYTSGQLGMAVDGTVPEGAREQAEICFGNIDAILGEAGAGRGDVVRINAYVTDRVYIAGYMAARDAWFTHMSAALDAAEVSGDVEMQMRSYFSMAADGMINQP